MTKESVGRVVTKDDVDCDNRVCDDRLSCEEQCGIGKPKESVDRSCENCIWDNQKRCVPSDCHDFDKWQPKESVSTESVRDIISALEVNAWRDGYNGYNDITKRIKSIEITESRLRSIIIKAERARVVKDIVEKMLAKMETNNGQKYSAEVLIFMDSIITEIKEDK